VAKVAASKVTGAALLLAVAVCLAGCSTMVGHKFVEEIQTATTDAEGRTIILTDRTVYKGRTLAGPMGEVAESVHKMEYRFGGGEAEPQSIISVGQEALDVTNEGQTVATVEALRQTAAVVSMGLEALAPYIPAILDAMKKAPEPSPALPNPPIP
jgi:hypothetical protein